MIIKPTSQKARGVSGLTILAAVMIMSVGQAEANVEKIKLYKNAFPGLKPQCLFCHVDKIPKKDVGLHELNAYGTKVKETAPEITEEILKQVGPFEDFKQEGAPANAAETQAKPACDPSKEECDTGVAGE